MEKLWVDVKWLVFQAQYCLGGNFFDSKICSDFRPWAIGAAALLALAIALAVWSRLAKMLRAFAWRLQQARVANKKTMDRYRWTGDDAKR